MTGESLEHIRYSATFEVFPDIEIGDISTIKIERPVVEITEDNVKKTVDVLIRQRATFEPVTRAAKQGDKVSLSLRSVLDGKELESTEKGQSIDLVIGEAGRVAEVDQNLIGMEPGSEKPSILLIRKGINQNSLLGRQSSMKLMEYSSRTTLSGS